MHLFNIATVFTLLLLVGVEFSVSAFVNPSAWRLGPEPQSIMLGHFAAVLGKVMPFWYAAGLGLLAAQTWLHWHTPGFEILLTASAMWLLTILATVLFLVPLNNRVAQSAAGWQAAHRTWDKRHRVRIAVLAAATVLLMSVVVR